MERALRGWVPAGHGPPSTANPNFWEICATLVCAAVLRVDPPLSLEQLSRRLRVPSPARSALPDGGRRTGTPDGVAHERPPDGQGPNATRRARGLPGGPHSRPTRRCGHPREPLRVGHHPHRHGCGRDCSPTPGRDELRALLVYLNEVPPDSQTGEAQKLHLHLATRLDLPPEFPQSNLRSQYTALGRLLPTRPELGHLVGEFVRDRRAEPPWSQTPAPDSQGVAKVAAASRANQAGGSGKPPGKGKGGPDYDTYSVAVMVRWRVNPRDSPEAIYPLSPGRLGMVLKKAFGDFRVSYIKDEG